MKTKLTLLALVACSTNNPQLATCFAQGSLTPPAGAPAPVMKSLDQIEARTPISSAPFTISQPGSYYLTTNLTVSTNSAILIATNNVSLDLNGFTIRSTQAVPSGYGIHLGNGLANIQIANGSIVGDVTNNGSGVFGGPGFYTGIGTPSANPRNALVTRVMVSGCMNGITVGTEAASVVESCSADTVAYYGIAGSVVQASTAKNCGGSAITGKQVADSTGVSVSSGYGITAYTVINSTGESKSSYGIYCTIVHDSTGNSENSYGIYGTTVENCYGGSSAYTGISAVNALNCVGYTVSGYASMSVSALAEGCSVYGYGDVGLSAGNRAIVRNCTAQNSDTGISVGTDSLVQDCMASGNNITGILTGDRSRVVDCVASGNGTSGTNGVGIITGIRSTVSGCNANDNRNDGIRVNGDSVVLNNHASHNALGTTAAAGIRTLGSGSRVEGNHVRDTAGTGILSSVSDIVIRNNSGGNNTNFFPTSGTLFAPIQNPATMTSPVANIAF